MTDIHKLIAAISPDVYCDSKARKEVKKIIKDGNYEPKAYLEAAGKAEPVKSDDLAFNYDKAHASTLSAWGLKYPFEEHRLVHDNVQEGLEPTYFWILDFMQDSFGLTVEKLVDNFTSSPGSGHFSEMGQKATRMQKEAMDMLGSANQVLKTILNLIYDLKEMKLILQTYDDLESDNKLVREGARLSLKQRWMDQVDTAKRGQGSINVLAQQLDFVTLRDGFMAAKSLEDVEDLDLNDRVKRILLQRIRDFNTWVIESGKQLRQRYKIERTYLKSQVNSVKLYARWIRPYLKAAQELEQRYETKHMQSALVTAFNTIVLELSLLGKAGYDPKGDVNAGKLPEVFAKVKARKYSSVVLVNFVFRGIPNRVGQRGDWAFGGRTEMHFRSYGLNNEELDMLKKVMSEDDLGQVMELIEGATDKSLKELQDDIDEFIKEDEEEKEKKEKARAKEEDVNPFTSLFSFVKYPKDKKDTKTKGIKSDSDYEKIMRSQAIIAARDRCFNLFDIYKRSRRMPAHQNPFDAVKA